MTSNSDSIDCSLSGVYKSWYAFRAGKRASRSIIAFEYNLEDNLAHLAKDIQSNQYRHGGYRYMEVHDSKRRTIAIANVRDRVVHRMLYDYLVPRLDRKFDFDVWSCRRGKGLQGAVLRTQSLLQKYPNSWVWRSDVAKFFDSVDHQVLGAKLDCTDIDPLARILMKEVTSSYQASWGCGIAIGNQTSQIISNIYLHELDRFVRHVLKPLGYVRYGDDFVLFLPTRVDAEVAQRQVAIYLAGKLKLKLNHKNTCIVRVRQGLHYLGLILYPDGMSIQPKTWVRMMSRLAKHNYDSYEGFVKAFGSRNQLAQLRFLYRILSG